MGEAVCRFRILLGTLILVTLWSCATDVTIRLPEGRECPKGQLRLGPVSGGGGPSATAGLVGGKTVVHVKARLFCGETPLGNVVIEITGETKGKVHFTPHTDGPGIQSDAVNLGSAGDVDQDFVVEGGANPADLSGGQINVLVATNDGSTQRVGSIPIN
jgi:hypothetical protein